MAHQIEIVEGRYFTGVVADELMALIGEAIDEKGEAVLCLAGGSTPSGLYRAISKPPRVSEIAWSKVSLWLGDERFVATDDVRSNAKMVTETLLQPIHSQAPRFEKVNTQLQDVAASAADYEQRLRSLNRDPIFDIVLLGLGEDGHTASLFPNSPCLEEKEKLVVSCPHPSDGTERISLSFRALTSASQIIFIVQGQKKAATIKRLFSEDVSVNDLPAAAILRAEVAVRFFLDPEAASLIGGRQ